ncbi:3-hydroxyacyl-CoA dehydrogenase family protein [Pseudohongiella sp.]|uniref:3-hydroxybutyryl-CoA dehydrogenase n=1 Tax=marine sediment metagenome TaxID=412755 RepID=A0A0F9W8U9_9ZZZZ|nr:3-hydroxyacyl-CoA dehydrogenase NAD-binding domain-containing protein [Pseudohongiella sp.]HDZ08116.1 3-hydroxybutyryl-CoA dehydrogenase [Pseudohongiella sp.]HEA63084.1 3-hydroxybutyryl-CoA dehydrogenase [Pseudohongiella sp.]
MISTLGVIGAGVMGRGVAQAAAQKGMRVVLLDIADDILAAADNEIRQAIRFAAMLDKKTSAESADDVCQRIEFTTDIGKLAQADFVVENVSEKVAIKQTLYPQLDRICKSDCVIAVNTSAISITRVGSWTERADKVVGMHFMNPVPMKPLVEVIRAHHTSDATIATAKQFLAQLGKEAVIVNDMPGFVSNRILMLTVNEAVFVVQDQVSSARDVDRIFKGCFGHKMGPLETADLIGLDTILFSLDVLYESYNDPKFRPAPLLRKMVDAGLHGRKSGEGFFKYPNLHQAVKKKPSETEMVKQ